MANKAFQIKARILKNTEVAPRYFKLLFNAPAIVKNSKPGQFVEIKVSDSYLPLLRRPLSIHRVGSRFSVLGSRASTEHRAPSTIEILYEVVGQGTDILSQKKAGEYLDIIGPLGNGFSVLGSRCSVLVAGGMGVAPLVFLAERLIKSTSAPAHQRTSAPAHKSQVVILIGAKTKNAILCEKEFKALGCKVQIATDDGSKGFKGRVTDLLKNLLRAPSTEHRAPIYACGPKPMLQELALISKEHNVAVEVSLEGHMACGIGACLGCVVNTRDGYKRVCKEGPVFDAQDIVW